MKKRGLPVLLAGLSILTVAGIISGVHGSNAGTSEVKASPALASMAPMPSADQTKDTLAAYFPAGNGPEIAPADSARALARLAEQISASVDLPNEVKSGHVGILVRSLSTNKQIFALNADKPLTPASTTKVVTTFTALSELGADFKIKTILAAAEKASDGVISGDLFVKGYGDPFLSASEIDALADQLIASGVHQIDGNVVGDGTYFDSKYDRTEYSGDEDEVEDLPPISALSVDNNRFSVVVTAPRQAGQALTVQTYPRSSGFDVDNDAVATAARARRASTPRKGRRRADLVTPQDESSIFRTASYVETSGGDELLADASGAVRRRPAATAKKPAAKATAAPKGKSSRKSAVKVAPAPSKKQTKVAQKTVTKKSSVARKQVEESDEPPVRAVAPANAGAGSLRVAIVGGRDQRQVIKVSGGLLAGRSASYRYEMKNPPLVVAGIVYDRLRSRGVMVKGRAVSGAAPQHFKVLAQQERPLTQVLSNVMKHSNNYLAEYTFKLIGAAAGGHQETARHTIQKITRRMSISQVPFGTCIINDGSGLSRANCLSAAALTGILTATYHDQKVFPTFYQCMSIAGVDGTLRRRMKGTDAEGNVHGKTGTLRNVSALTGYAVTRDGEVVAFAMLMNGGNHGAYRATQDRVAEKIASFSYTEGAGTTVVSK